MPDQTCRWCSSPATRLCDKPKGGGTCDAPMCADHGRRVYHSFRCSNLTGEGMQEVAIDHCPDCEDVTRWACESGGEPVTVPWRAEEVLEAIEAFFAAILGAA